MSRVGGLFEHLTLPQKERVIERVAFETGDSRLGIAPTFLEKQYALPLHGIPSRQLKAQVDVGIILSEWEKTLIAIEALYGCVPAEQQQELPHWVDGFLQRAEVDLGVEWRDGHFWRKGARLLDDALVHESLEWLADASFGDVRRPFMHGLRLHRMASHDSETLKSAVGSMYEAVEAMAKLLTRSDKDLSALKDRVAEALDLPKELRRILDSYVEYGCRFRHSDAVAGAPRGRRPPLGEAEAEFFLYLTGLLLRLATRKIAERGSHITADGSSA